MIEHVYCTYEAFDGMMFDDEDDCMNYELNTLYRESGIRFVTSTHHIVEDLGFYSDKDDVYNMAMYITINREKDKENKKFVDYAIKSYGWVLLEDLDLRFGSGRKYRMEMSNLVEIE